MNDWMDIYLEEGYSSSSLNCFFFRIQKLLGYRADDIVGQSVYSYHHALDTETLDKTFRTRESIN